jgi:hypothetical protein
MRLKILSLYHTLATGRLSNNVDVKLFQQKAINEDIIQPVQIINGPLNQCRLGQVENPRRQFNIAAKQSKAEFIQSKRLGSIKGDRQRQK